MEVRFLVDGAVIGTDNTAPYSVDWDTSGATDGDHVLRIEADDAAGNTGVSTDVTVTIRNVVQFLAALSGSQEVPPVDSSGSAAGDITVNLVTGAVSGSLTVSGITPTAAHIHDAYAGATGGVVIPLDQDPNDGNIFTVPAAAALDAPAVDRLLAGALYLNVHSAAYQAGELRGQLLTDDLEIRFVALAGDESVPRVASVASGRAGVTINTATGALVVHARVTGLDDATMAHVHEAYAGDTGGVVVGLAQDQGNPGRWLVEDGSLNASGLDAYAAGRLYINVHSPDNPGGEIRGQIVPEGVTLMFSELRGEQEVPAVDSRATGLAAITLVEQGSILTLHANTVGLSGATGAHLHGAYGGTNGPVAVGLAQDGSNPAHWFVEEEVLDAAELEALLAGATYVNVHTPAHQGGEIRGQVVPQNILFAFGHLEGRQEVPAVDSQAGGTFAVTVDPNAMTLVAHANTTGAGDATAAHLHNAFAGSGGGVAIPLAQDANEASRWSADVDPLSADHLAAFLAGRLYVNVHTPTNPTGEIRGQVAPEPVEVLFTSLSGDQEVPAVASAASGLAATTVNRETGAVTLHMHVEGADDASGAHIHGAYAGQNGGVVIGLQKDAGDAGHWFATDGQMDPADLADYLQGRLYVNVHTPANPTGEIRGQISPKDIQIVFGAMSGDQVVPPVVTAATGTVTTTVDLRARSLVAFVNAIGADDATAAGIHVGGVGTNGDEILPLQQTANTVSQWSAMTEPLTTADFSAYRAGRLYALLSTPAEINGELRGQIVPPDAVFFDDLDPVVTLTSPGASVSGTATLQAEASDDQAVAVVRFYVGDSLIGSDDTAPYSIDWDTTATANGQVMLTAEADDLAGNTGTSAAVAVTVDNPVPVTLSQIQAEVFTPMCSGCHSGPTSGNLPSGMNLSSAAASFAALVNVQSLQVALDRVEPGNPDDSYLIRKLENAPGIVGGSMPQGGPALDQATIDEIRQWITDGAPNN